MAKNPWLPPLWQWLFCAVYVVGALAYLDVPGMPNPGAPEVGFIGDWTLFTVNILGSLVFVLISQICWHAGIWFYAATFTQLNAATFVALVAGLVGCGIVQWLALFSVVGKIRERRLFPRPSS